MFRLIRLLFGLLICPLHGTVLHNAETLGVLACSAGSVCWRLLVILILARITRISTLFLSLLLRAGCLITRGGSVVGSWRREMNSSCLSISELWTALNHPLRRFLNMSSKILILPGRLGFLNFPNSIKRLVMSVVFVLLAAGVMLAALWVLSIRIKIP